MYALLHQTPVNFKIYCCQTHDAIPMPKTTVEEILTNCKHMVLVISPLIGLMKNQVEILKAKGVRSVCLRHEEEDYYSCSSELEHVKVVNIL